MIANYRVTRLASEKETVLEVPQTRAKRRTIRRVMAA
jgi:hypothetical protein